MVKQIQVYTIQTKEVSIWSGQHVEFYFKDKYSADEFVSLFNSIDDINIEFDHIGYVDKNSSATIKLEIKRSPKEAVDYLYNWGVSFTIEHQK